MKRIEISITERAFKMTQRDRWVSLVGVGSPLIGAEALLWAVVHDDCNYCLAIQRSATLLCDAWAPKQRMLDIRQLTQPSGCATCNGSAGLKPLFGFLQQGGLWLEAEAASGRLSAWLTRVFGDDASAAVNLRGGIKRLA